jgi:hypothetical protein
LDRRPVVEGVSRVDAEAWREDFFHVLEAVGVMTVREQVHGTAIPRAMGPFVQDLLLDGLKTLCGMERMTARPRLLCSEEAVMPLVGCNAQQVRQGVCHRGADTRQGARPPGPLGPDTLAHTMVPGHVRELEVLFNGSIRTWARVGGFGAKGTGLVAATDLEMTAQDEGGGPVTRPRTSTDTPGQGQASVVPVSGCKVMGRIAARTTIPLAVKVAQMHASAALWTRAVVRQAQAQLAGAVRRQKGVVAQGVVAGPARWWRAPHGLVLVGPAQATRAGTADARAQAAAGEEITVGRRGHTVRHRQGKAAGTERLEPAGVGLTGGPTEDPDGTPEQGRHHHRRDFPPTPSTAVVVRTWHGRDDGTGGHPVFLTKASGPQPWPPCNDDDDRRRIEHGGLKDTKPPWALGHPLQKPARAVPGPGTCTRLLVALATAYRLLCAHEAPRGEPVGGHRWRRQLLEQTRDQVIVCAQGWYGLVPLAAFALRAGGKRKDLPPGIGTRQESLATYGLPTLWVNLMSESQYGGMLLDFCTGLAYAPAS